ncbi:MAG TPA: hypothetical protein VIQ05_27260 [Tardiphaga sp.]
MAGLQGDIFAVDQQQCRRQIVDRRAEVIQRLPQAGAGLLFGRPVPEQAGQTTARHALARAEAQAAEQSARPLALNFDNVPLQVEHLHRPDHVNAQAQRVLQIIDGHR